jgi:hypothetical protein
MIINQVKELLEDVGTFTNTNEASQTLQYKGLSMEVGRCRHV